MPCQCYKHYMRKTWRPKIGESVKYYDIDVCKDKVGVVLGFHDRGSYPWLVSDPDDLDNTWWLAAGEMEPVAEACAAKPGGPDAA